MAFQNCIDRIVKAAGRALTDDELTAIIGRVSREVVMLARKRGLADKDGSLPPAQSLPPDLFREAGDSAAQGLLYDAQKKQQRVALAILKRQELGEKIAKAPTTVKGLGEALLRVDGRGRAIYRRAAASMLDTLTATNPRFFGMIEDAKGLRELVREMFGEDTGNATAKAGAKAWHETTETLRRWFNAAGGDIGLLRNWGMIQSHSARLVYKFGKLPWVEYVMKRIDSARYINDDGSRMREDQIRSMFGEAWESLSSDGAYDIEPGKQGGTSATAKRHAEHRIIHFKNADDWLDYHNKFAGRGIYDAMLGHIQMLSRDIGMIEGLGPNPTHSFEYFRDVARKEGASGIALSHVEDIFAQVSGTAHGVADHRLAMLGKNVRGLTVASKLGGAVFSSISDFATAIRTVAFNRLPPMRYVRNMIESFNPLDRNDIRVAQRGELALESLLNEVNRWGEDSLAAGWSDKLASFTIRASFLSMLTEANRRAYSKTHLATLGDLTRGEWADLHESDKAQLTYYEITPDDWKLLQKVDGEDYGSGNNRVLTGASIRRLTDEQIGKAGAAAESVRNNLSAKVLDMVLGETDYAVVTPGAKERALMIGTSGKRGTWGGEFARTLWLFKSFPMAMISKHGMRGWGMPTVGGKATYAVSLFITTSVLGAVALQLKDVTKGKDPRDMTTGAFWLAAAAQGGGLGILGDYAFTDQSRFGHSPTETAAGPLFGGLLPDVLDLTMGNIHEAGRGEPTHFAAEALKLAENNAPGVNVWYLRFALDHLFLQQLQEYVSPGYLQKVRERQINATGQGNWWEPGKRLPGH